MTTALVKHTVVFTALAAVALAGCDHAWFGKGKSYAGPGADRPFPLGQVTDAHWETQQTNAEAADFIFFDHEFRGSTAQLAPGGKKHLEQVALRWEHVPFPVVIEESPHNSRPELDQARRRTVVEQLARLGVLNAEERVVVANAFAEGITGIEAEAAYYNGLGGGGADSAGFGRRFGGTGAFFR
jgi:hypothetical protein